MCRRYRSSTVPRLLHAVLVIAGGCASSPSVSPVAQPPMIGRQIQRTEPSLKESRFSTLLDFESDSDDVFLTTTGGRGTIVTASAHTGRASYETAAHTARVAVKVPSLLAGRVFPGDWTLIGGYVFSTVPGRITVTLEPRPENLKPREIDLTPGAWTPVFIELAGAPAKAPLLVFDLANAAGPLRFDDIMLVDNQKVFVGDDTNAPWRIARQGFNYVGTAPGQFNFTLATTDAASNGWTLDEADTMRARFRSSGDGNGAKNLTVYYDGRAIWDGQYRAMSAAAQDPLYASAHQSPGSIEISQDMGRLDRNSLGDANNDGYNEVTGSYRIIAAGPRLELRISPHGSPLIRPVLEFSGLPPGKALVTLEGRLIEQTCRMENGVLLVELPARIDRTATINLRIE